MERDALFEVGRRTFDTPEFRGIEFIEVEAKSIINHVPGNFLPFNWTINPYRGCSHACTYCAAGETPVLLADGRTKPIADLKVGDEIYGTERQGTYRHYAKTRVLAHWRTVKPAYRTTLEDGTQLVTSGDHRFLSNRGWKFVTGSEQGPLIRPHLTTNNRLLGPGPFVEPPTPTIDYRAGYLCGMIRGDGTIGSYEYPRPGRTSWDVHRFRLALVDLEALSRTKRYLAAFEIVTDEFAYREAAGGFQAARAIRTQSRGRVEAIRELIRWPSQPSLDWCKGFLAGIFDAEGSCSQGVFRISNKDDAILGKTAFCLRRLGFGVRLEDAVPERAHTIRILGGLKELFRFFQTVDPAITRKRDIVGRALKNSFARRVVSVQDLGIEMPMYDITTGTGDFIANGVVNHNCFARVTHTYMDLNAGSDFESKIYVKVNAADVLRRQLGSKRWKGDHIAMGTATDPYQRAEGRYKLMRGIIEALASYRNPFSILTKGTLIQRDLDLLVDAAKVTNVSTAFSIATLDEDAWRKAEPGTPHPRKRIEAVAALNDAGIPCGVMVAAVLPGINDSRDQLREIVRAAIDAGATHVSPILLHLRPVVKEEYMRWLKDEFPELVTTYDRMYARSAYAPSADRKALGEKVSDLVREAGGLRLKPGIAPRFNHRRSEAPAQPRAEGQQLALL
jgi:DNA repair photolyase